MDREIGGQGRRDEVRERRIASESQLALLACILGAEKCGGALSPREDALIAAARQEEPLVADFVDDVRQDILAGGDPLGEMLCSLRPAAVRRRHGAFYTPASLVDAMAGWLFAHPLDRVVDSGCGSGRFAVAVSRRHSGLPLIAIDTDPLATLLTRAALAVTGARNAQVCQDDYLTYELPRFSGRTGFIANPPYVRHHDLSAQAKAWAANAAKRLGIAVSGLAGLHTLFFLATALKARDGDVGCFVTSAEWLDTRYGQAIRQLLTDRLSLRVLAVLRPEAMPFADAMSTAAITCFVAGTPAEHVTLSISDTPESVHLDAADGTIERCHLINATRWSPFLRRERLPPTGSPHVTLRTIARVHRGVATGGNEFFVLTREQARLLGVLPWCRPAITRAQEILQANGVIHDGPERRLLLVVPPDIDRQAHPALDAYLRLGEQAHNGRSPVAQGYLATHRRPWWYLGPVTAPPIVASYMARQAPAFAYNPDGLVLLNIAHGIYPHQTLGEAQTVSLVAQLNGARMAFRGRGRTYQGGLEKFEPREMEELPIDLEALADVFRLTNLRDARDTARLTLFWEHDLTPLAWFLRDARP